MFSLQHKLENKRAEQELLGVGEEWEVAQTMYKHVNKCKNDKIKERKISKKGNLMDMGVLVSIILFQVLKSLVHALLAFRISTERYAVRQN
jgi:hypothetical protein